MHSARSDSAVLASADQPSHRDIGPRAGTDRRFRLSTLFFGLTLLSILANAFSFRSVHTANDQLSQILEEQESWQEIRDNFAALPNVLVAVASPANNVMRSSDANAERGSLRSGLNYAEFEFGRLRAIIDRKADGLPDEARRKILRELSTIEATLPEIAFAAEEVLAEYDRGGVILASDKITALNDEVANANQVIRRLSNALSEGQKTMAARQVARIRRVQRNAEVLSATSIAFAPLMLAFGALLQRRERRERIDRERDLERIRTNERLLRETAQRLEESNRDLQDFAYVASHDLQEPLRKIIAFGDRLKSKYGEPLGADGGDYLERMQSAAGRMQTLIQDLLTFSRVNAKGQTFRAVDLSAVAAGVVSDLEVAIERNDATVTIGQLPTIIADPTQMRQLFQNLLGNALKFRKPEVAPALSIRCEVLASGSPLLSDELRDRPETFVRIEVEDNGIGFDEKYLDRIFKVFQRLHGRGEYEGSGVGLSVCRRIAEGHRGEITARSATGSGTTFIVTIPTVQDMPDDVNTDAAATSTTALTPVGP